jgi:endoglucanase
MGFTDDMNIVVQKGYRAATIDEGGTISFSLQVLNYKVGARMILWMTNNAPGTSGNNIVGDGDWLQPWSAVIGNLLTANGFDVQRLSATTTPKILGQLAFAVTVNSAYQGQKLVFTNTNRKNQRTENNNPRSAQIYLMTKISSSDPDVTATFGPNNIAVNDTSQSPAGSPSIGLGNSDIDGSVQKTTMYPGMGLRVTVNTTNIASFPGTKAKIYIANVGQKMFDPAFRDRFIDALRSTQIPGIGFEVTNYPPPAGQSWYNGATIVFKQGYSDSTPFSFTFNVGNQVPDDGGSYQFDVILNVVKDGTANDFDVVTYRGDWNSTATYAAGDYVNYVNDGGKYLRLTPGSGGSPTDANWRVYIPTNNARGSFSGFLHARPPRYWEVRATTDGSTISYSVHVPLNTNADTVTITSTGNEPAGFQTAMANAFAASGIATIAGGVITAGNPPDFDHATVSWSIPYPTNGSGKHGLVLSNPTGPSPIPVAETCVFLSSIILPNDPKFITGVNLSSGEFGRKANTGYDNYGYNYRYQSRVERDDPTQRYQVMDYYWSKGVRIIRIPFLWARLQDNLYGPIATAARPDVLTGSTRADGFRIDDIIRYWTGLGGIAMPDCHNFGNGPDGSKVGYDQPTPVEALCNLWVQIAMRYAGNPRVWFGLMNEPNGYIHSPTRNRDNLQTVINAIRNRTPALNKILVAACEYSSSQNFVSNGQADAFATLYDPANNYAVEIHCYFDSDASGTNAVCVAGTDYRVDSAIAWANADPKRPKLFFGEIAGSDPNKSGQQACGSVVPSAYQKITNNKNACLGFTVWGAGDMWGQNYIFNLDPVSYTNAVDINTMLMAEPFFTVVQ